MLNFGRLKGEKTGFSVNIYIYIFIYAYVARQAM